jgi:hypothetical protein
MLGCEAQLVIVFLFDDPEIRTQPVVFAAVFKIIGELAVHPVEFARAGIQLE